MTRREQDYCIAEIEDAMQIIHPRNTYGTTPYSGKTYERNAIRALRCAAILAENALGNDFSTYCVFTTKDGSMEYRISVNKLECPEDE